MEKQIIVTTFDGAVATWGEVVGALGVHKSLGNSKRWTLTHLPSGRFIRSFNKKSDAVRCAKELVTAIDWTAELSDEAKAIVRPILNKWLGEHNLG